MDLPFRTERADAPLAERLRPRRRDDLVGPARAVLDRILPGGRLVSAVVWGPPGCGKTSLARLAAELADRPFEALSAVLAGVGELRAALARAEAVVAAGRPAPILFVDEIHRWNKAQQDALLPHLERGVIALLGATTENPAFELNAALRSRLAVLRLDPLSPGDVRTLLDRATALWPGPIALPGALDALAARSGGDARRALNDLERLAAEPGHPHDTERVSAILTRADLRHDATGTDHFEVVSALIKSLRASDPDGAIYWLARMLAAGEDPEFVARRLVLFAAEDVGLADPAALPLATAALVAVQNIGMPEARLPLATVAIHLAAAPKSNSAYLAIGRATEEVARTGALPVPDYFRPGSGGYLYPHDQAAGVGTQPGLPSALAHVRFYEPIPVAAEKILAERLAWFRRKRTEK